MPDVTPSPVIGAGPGASPQQPGASSPIKPPFGSTPSVTPTPNPGLEVAGVQRLGVVLRMLTETLPMVGATSEVGKSVLNAIKDIAKHVKPGSVTPAGEANQLQKAQLQNAQNASILQRLRAGQAGPGAGGPPGGMPMPQQGSPPPMA